MDVVGLYCCGTGRTYEVWVRAENETGKGERVHATVTLPEEKDGPTGPGAPLSVQALARGKGGSVANEHTIRPSKYALKALARMREALPQRLNLPVPFF